MTVDTNTLYPVHPFREIDRAIKTLDQHHGT